MTVVAFVVPDAEGFTPNGYVESCPGYYMDSGPCTYQCCMPEAYPLPHVWYCQNFDCAELNARNGGRKFPAKLREAGECINCLPPLA